MDTHKYSIMGPPSPELDAKWDDLTQCKFLITVTVLVFVLIEL